jgi:hypothetical protein
MYIHIYICIYHIYIMYIVTRKNSKVESNLNSDDLLVYLFGGAIYQNRGSEIAEDNESWSQFAITL